MSAGEDDTSLQLSEEEEYYSWPALGLAAVVLAHHLSQSLSLELAVTARIFALRYPLVRGS